MEKQWTKEDGIIFDQYATLLREHGFETAEVWLKNLPNQKFERFFRRRRIRVGLLIDEYRSKLINQGPQEAIEWLDSLSIHH